MARGQGGEGSGEGQPHEPPWQAARLLEKADSGGSAGTLGPRVSPWGQSGLGEGGGSWAGGETWLPAALSGERLRISSSAQAKLAKNFPV